MNKLTTLFTAALLPLAALAQDPAPAGVPAAPQVEIKDEQVKEIASYTIGYSMAKQLSQDETAIDKEIVLEALNNELAGKEPKFSEGEMEAAMRKFQEQQRETAIAKIKTEGETFLKDNATNGNVVVTKSGLQYTVETLGEGEKPTATDKVTVHYTGTLINGQVFDSSRQRNQPASFPLNGVIPGWTEGLQLMPVGSKFRFFIPSDIAYGERGSRDPRSGRYTIPPHSMLIFDVELISID